MPESCLRLPILEPLACLFGWGMMDIEVMCLLALAFEPFFFFVGFSFCGCSSSFAYVIPIGSRYDQD